MTTSSGRFVRTPNSAENEEDRQWAPTKRDDFGLKVHQEKDLPMLYKQFILSFLTI